MFKKLVAQIADIITQDDFDAACGAIDRAFQSEKITWKDYELLYRLLAQVNPN